MKNTHTSSGNHCLRQLYNSVMIVQLHTCVMYTSLIVSPIFAGDRVTLTPAALSASIFSSAPPFPPAIIAPACPVQIIQC